jgi:hypothetical protein
VRDPSVFVTDSSERGPRASVSAAVLLAGVESTTPAGAAMVAAFVTEAVAVEAIVAVRV